MYLANRDGVREVVGLPDRVVVVPYNPTWPSDFSAESEPISHALSRTHPEDRQAYVDGKDEFVKEHEAEALNWRRAFMGK